MQKSSFLKGAFSENLGVKSISLLLAITLFFWVRADQESTVTTNVPLRLVLPSGTMIMGGNAPDSVRVTVRGRESDLARFNRNQLDPIVLELNVLDHERPVSIPFDSIKTPSGVRVTNIVPGDIVVQIDNESTRLVTIKPRIIGAPKEPFHLGKISVTPEKIRVSGPKSLIERLDKIETEAIDVSGQRTSLDRNVRLRIDDSLITYNPTDTIMVHIPIDAQFGTRLLTGLSVIEVNAKRRVVLSPDVVNIEFTGPTILLSKVNPDALHVVVDLAGFNLKEGTVKRVRPLIKNIPEGVSLKKMEPEMIEIRPVILAPPIDLE